MKRPECDNVVAIIQSINARKEHHGEELHLAIDVGVLIARENNAIAFDHLAECILEHGSVPDADGPQGANEQTTPPDEMLTALHALAASITFAAEWENIRVSIRQGTRKVAILPHAKINKPKMNKSAQEITLRLQSRIDHQSVGLLARALQESVSIDISPAQTPLDLPDGEPDGE